MSTTSAICEGARAGRGLRQREWTAIGDTEVAVVPEMARCLREIAAGRVPK